MQQHAYVVACIYSSIPHTLQYTQYIIVYILSILYTSQNVLPFISYIQSLFCRTFGRVYNINMFCIIQRDCRLLMISFVYTQPTRITLGQQLSPHVALAVYYLASEPPEFTHALDIVLCLTLASDIRCMFVMHALLA